MSERERMIALALKAESQQYPEEDHYRERKPDPEDLKRKWRFYPAFDACWRD